MCLLFFHLACVFLVVSPLLLCFGVCVSSLALHSFRFHCFVYLSFREWSSECAVHYLVLPVLTFNVQLRCEDHIVRISFISKPQEIITALAELRSFVQHHKRMVCSTLTRRLRGTLSADPTIWHGEVEAAVCVFETQCQADRSFLSQQLRKARGVYRHSARIAQEEEGVVTKLNCDLAEGEARVVALKKEVFVATKRSEEFRRLEEEFKAECEQLQLRMGQCSAEDATVQEVSSGNGGLIIAILSAIEAFIFAILDPQPSMSTLQPHQHHYSNRHF